MKTITGKVQRLAQRAAELKQLAESVPGKVAEARATLATATADVQKLRADIISSVGTLRAETDTQLITALREIDGSADVLAEAGYLLERTDLDLGPTRRVTVTLERVEDVDEIKLKHLISANAHAPTLHALLQAILKADQLTGSVDLEELNFTKLTIDVGLIPSVRVGWTTNTPRRAAFAAAAPIPPPVASTLPSAFGQGGGGGFFERRDVSAATVPAQPVTLTTAAAPVVVQQAAQVVVQQVPVPAPASNVTAPTRSRASALDRFKKMPDLTKR
ncbi:MAG TPA: hypothetical protein VGE76_10645 [Opitutaceae bacterium]